MEHLTVMTDRRQMTRILLTVLLAALSSFASAQDAAYPNKPVYIVVGFSAGGGSDVVARAVAAKMNNTLGQPVLVENRTGADGSIGAEAVARSRADGYMVYLATASNVINAGAAANGTMKLNYDIQKDFSPVVLLVRNQNVLVVNPTLPVSNLRELIQLARSKPGTLNFGSAGTTMQLADELFRQMADIDFVDIPYKGGAPVVTDLLGGQVQVAIIDVSVVLAHIRSGKLKAIAVGSAKRFEGLPDVPTFAEAGVSGYEATGWLGLMVPAGTPPEVISRLREAAVKALAYPDVRERLTGLGITPAAGTSAEYAAFLRAEIDKWAKVLRAGRITLGR